MMSAASDQSGDLLGFSVPVHRALTEPILLCGAPRAIAIMNGTLAGAVGLGLRSQNSVHVVQGDDQETILGVSQSSNNSDIGVSGTGNVVSITQLEGQNSSAISVSGSGNTASVVQN